MLHDADFKISLRNRGFGNLFQLFSTRTIIQVSGLRSEFFDGDRSGPGTILASDISSLYGCKATSSNEAILGPHFASSVEEREIECFYKLSEIGCGEVPVTHTGL
jgi:hypothetical protein